MTRAMWCPCHSTCTALSWRRCKELLALSKNSSEAGRSMQAPAAKHNPLHNPDGEHDLFVTRGWKKRSEDEGLVLPDRVKCVSNTLSKSDLATANKDLEMLRCLGSKAKRGSAAQDENKAPPAKKRYYPFRSLLKLLWLSWQESSGEGSTGRDGQPGIRSKGKTFGQQGPLQMGEAAGGGGQRTWRSRNSSKAVWEARVVFPCRSWVREGGGKAQSREWQAAGAQAAAVGTGMGVQAQHPAASLQEPVTRETKEDGARMGCAGSSVVECRKQRRMAGGRDPSSSGGWDPMGAGNIEKHPTMEVGGKRKQEEQGNEQGKVEGEDKQGSIPSDRSNAATPPELR
ncbi:hypothetical protein C8R44DRAFT_750453 [Mycena epipterygia]|nr:hypothetical protein C8R44DRAFT_750453 [Mycena epipterygia]